MNFIFSNLSYFSLAVWLIFFFIVILRAFPLLLPRTYLGFVSMWCNNISYRWLVAIAFSVHILYGIFATWGQYVVWERGSDFTRTLLSSPLPVETPLPVFLEWIRPFFAGEYGYFVFYTFNEFFLSTVALLVVVGLFWLFLVVRAQYRPINFREGDIMLIVLALLIAGWPGVIILLPFGLIFAVILSVWAGMMYGAERIPLPPAFLLASPFALIFGIRILTLLDLYPLLKL